MNYSPGISVVVPVFSSESSLEILVRRIEEVFHPQTVFEIILVNDCSWDASWKVIEDLCQQNPNVHGINLMRNYGQHNALLCGIRCAQYETIVTIDDDLQNPPSEIPKLIKKLDEGFDVVYGTPQHEQHGMFRNFSSQITKLTLQSVMGVDVARKVSAFRAFRSILTQAFDHYHSNFVSLDVLLTWGTTKFASVPVRHEPRLIGVSNYTLRKLLLHALNMLTGFSSLPLQVASYMGFVFTFLGMLVLIFVVGRYIIEGGSVPGFAFLASIIVIFSGAQLFAIGVIGEYLSRIFYRSLEKPPYVIRQYIGK